MHAFRIAFQSVIRFHNMKLDRRGPALLMNINHSERWLNSHPREPSYFRAQDLIEGADLRVATLAASSCTLNLKSKGEAHVMNFGCHCRLLLH